MQQKSSAKALLAISLAVSGLLSGCQTLDDWQADEYRKQCATLGIQPGSAHFDECMLQQQALDESETEHSLDRMQREEAARHKK